MNLLDGLGLAVICISGLRSGYKGFIKEFFGLVVFIGSLFLGCRHYYGVSLYLNVIENTQIRYFIAWGSLFLMGLIFGAILLNALQRLFESVGLSSTNSLLGMLFGLLLGTGLLVLSAGIAQSFTSVNELDIWKNSLFAPQFALMANGLWAWIKVYLLPILKEISEHLGFKNLF